MTKLTTDEPQTTPSSGNFHGCGKLILVDVVFVLWPELVIGLYFASGLFCAFRAVWHFHQALDRHR